MLAILLEREQSMGMVEELTIITRANCNSGHSISYCQFACIFQSYFYHFFINYPKSKVQIYKICGKIRIFAKLLQHSLRICAKQYDYEKGNNDSCNDADGIGSGSCTEHGLSDQGYQP